MGDLPSPHSSSRYLACTVLQDKTITPTACKNSLPVAGVGSIDKAEIAQQIAAALVAQGKTDVSSEELAALVDAVVSCNNLFIASLIFFLTIYFCHFNVIFKLIVETISPEATNKTVLCGHDLLTNGTE